MKSYDALWKERSYKGTDDMRTGEIDFEFVNTITAYSGLVAA